jgi:GntR family transcriptional regulator
MAGLFIDAALAAKLPEGAFKTKTALRPAASIPGIKIAEARQTLTVGTADIETANLLDVPLNAPVCFVDRSATDQRNRLALVSKGIYRGDMVRMDVKLR